MLVSIAREQAKTLTQPAKGPRLLLVDDDRVVLATLADGLRDAGYEVDTAASGRQAIEQIGKSPPDLAILDVRMPEMDGIELAQHIRAHTQVPVLFLSAYGDLTLVRRACEHGALGYVIKPVDIPQLVPPIEAALIRGRELVRLRESEIKLNTALAVEQKTRMAVGVLMERQRLDRRTAFEALRRQARSQRRKITEVADDILNAAEALNAPRPPHHSEP